MVLAFYVVFNFKKFDYVEGIGFVLSVSVGGYMSNDVSIKLIKEKALGIDPDTKEKLRRISRSLGKFWLKKRLKRNMIEYLELVNIFFTGYGGIFLEAWGIKRFTARELSVRTGTPIAMVRKWIRIGEELGVIERTFDPKGFLSFSIKRSGIPRIKSRVLEILCIITQYREVVQVEPFLSIEEALNFVNSFLSLFTMMGERIRDIFCQEVINIETNSWLADKGFRVVLKRWLEKASDYGVVKEIEGGYRVNKKALAPLFGKLIRFFEAIT